MAETTIGLLRASIDKHVRESGAKAFLIDGFPRETSQAVAFEKEVCACDMCIVSMWCGCSGLGPADSVSYQLKTLCLYPSFGPSGVSLGLRGCA